MRGRSICPASASGLSATSSTFKKRAAGDERCSGGLRLLLRAFLPLFSHTQISDTDPDNVTFWRTYRRSVIIVTASAILDMAGRIALEFEMRAVSAFESILFATGAVLLLRAAKLDVGQPRARKTDIVLSALFVIAAIRAGIWATTGHVLAANITALVISLLGLGVWTYRKGRTVSQESEPT